ncbi:PorT family protein [Hymenobacter sp. 15J16-1T3B]|uniref:outer membrane beta-barrel protein n=1 Tax=Hymenobacter sp. 15J16-1T3B TaxID=2886941 RepID=UPI001D10A019|nr:outer membrane beta-barrel protein [Hymenobacter sp. 15J16-1T3B]MCC3155887.1 PorT family protein [Hymenobacter sp. 15J16-1T3B]
MTIPLLFAGLLGASLLATPAAAQIDVHVQPPGGPLKLRYGLRVGGLSARTTRPSPYIYFNGQAHLYGLQGGVAAELAWGWLAVQPALVYSQKGHVFDNVYTRTLQGQQYKTHYRDKLRLNYLELPVNFVATVHRVQLLAGPYVAWAVSGYTLQHDQSVGAGANGSFDNQYRERLHFGRGSDYRLDYFRRFDAGFNAGLGYRLGPVQAQLTYARGFVDFDYPAPDPANRTIYSGYQGNSFNRHHDWQLHATYFFGGE